MKIFPSQKQIVLPYRADIENLLNPAAKRFEVGGSWWLAVPHTVDAVRLLRNLQLNPAAPIQYYYDWAAGTPFDSQRVTADLLTVNRRAYVLSEMGVGKTRAALYAYDWLRSVGLVKSLLVVAPLSTLVSVWQNEIFEHFHHLTTAVIYGDKKRRLKILSVPADVYIINHEGVEVVNQELYKRGDIDTVIVDELASYRNSQTNRWKFLKPIITRSTYAWGLTGSPTPNAPTDAYGQIKLLTPERVGFSFKRFKDQTMRQLGPFRWIARPDANDTVIASMQPSIRFTRDQCFDLPPTTYSARDIPIEPAVAKAYKKMFDELAVQVRTKQITAANEGVKLSKLLQLAAGFIYDGDGKGHYIGGAKRIREIIDIIDAAKAKVIVFAPFRYYVEILAGVLGRKYRVGMIHGEVKKAKRDEIFTGFEKSSDVQVIVAHPRTMSHGLTLVAADTIIWAAPTTSAETYTQANARITRSGQINNTQIIHLQSTKAEYNVYSRLKRNLKTQGALLEMFEQASSVAGAFA
jgi:SNF2 family DNA or RNA helicase